MAKLLLSGLGAKRVEIIAGTFAAAFGVEVDPTHAHLFQNDFAPGPFSVIGDFQQADYPGYPDYSVVQSPQLFWNTNLNGWVVQFGELLTWTTVVPPEPQPDVIRTQPIYGCYGTNVPGTQLHWWFRFGESVIAPNPGDMIVANPIFALNYRDSFWPQSR